MKKKNRVGLTMIELAVIIVLILIVAIIGAVEFSDYADKTRRNRTLVSVKSLADALKIYRLENNSQYPAEGPVHPLAPYTDITRFFTSFDMTKDVITGVKGVAIDVDGQATCIHGIVNKIDPEYRVTICAEDGGTNKTNTENQPNCCWTKDGLDCTNPANWYPCSTKM